jgi:glycosyltransferase involved in cell wall biosynthesis
MPLVSVVIPTFNCAPYLAESLESVLRQTTRGHEIVVVDDGSTDETPTVLARYAGRISVVHTPHGGYAAARNRGIEVACGDWIAFHDADDVALPDRIASLFDAVQQTLSADGVFATGERMDTGERIVPPMLARRAAAGLLTPEIVFAGFPVYFQAALVRRDAFLATGPFDQTLQLHADMDYGYRLFTRFRLRFVDRVVFRYRWHASNVTRDRLRGREEIARVVERLASGDGELLRRIGPGRVRARLARHYYSIARHRLRRGERDAGRAALTRAIALRPLNPRYRWLHAWGTR